MDNQFFLSIVVGLCLSAACGFKVFVPPLAIGLANKAGVLSLTGNTEWIGTWPAIVVFSLALVFEIAGFCIPILANILDVIATPLAIVVGVLAMSSQLDTLSPVLKWTLSIVGGGGISGTVQIVTATMRAGTSVLTAGFTNVFFVFLELVTAVIVSVMSLVAPILCLLLIIFLIVALVRILRNSFQNTT